jgi:CRP-like cAMP-binding protein
MMSRLQKSWLKSGVISTRSGFRFTWDIFMIFLIIYVAVSVPLVLGFGIKLTPTIFLLDALIDVLFIMDIILNFFTTYIDPDTKEEVVDRRKIVRAYIAFWFWPDLIGSVPVALIEASNPGAGHAMRSVKFIRVMKLFRVLRIFNSHIAKRMEGAVIHPGIFRMIKIVLAFLLLTHLTACFYWYVSMEDKDRLRGDDAAGMVYNAEEQWPFDTEWETETLGKKYIEAMHFALTAIASNRIETDTTGQSLYMCACLFLAFIVNATIVGSAANVLAHLDSHAAAKKSQMDGINQYMRIKKVPNSLSEKIRSYYDFLWDTRLTRHNQELFGELPPKLKLQLDMTLKRPLLMKVPLFKMCPTAGLIALVECLEGCITIPDELIVKEGEQGDCMFFIGRGSVRIYVTEGNEDVYLLTLLDGSYFGEIALVDKNSTRTASVRSATFCELQVLKAHHFETILDAFPDFAQALLSSVKARRNFLSGVNKMHEKKRKMGGPAEVDDTVGSLNVQLASNGGGRKSESTRTGFGTISNGSNKDMSAAATLASLTANMSNEGARQFRSAGTGDRIGMATMVQKRAPGGNGNGNGNGNGARGGTVNAMPF